MRSDRLCKELASEEDECDQSEALRAWCLSTPVIAVSKYDNFDEFERLSERALSELLVDKPLSVRLVPGPPPLEIDRSGDLRTLEKAADRRAPTLLYGPRGAGISWLVKRWVEDGLHVDGKAVPAAQLAQALQGPFYAEPGTEAESALVRGNFAADALTNAVLSTLPSIRRIAIDHYEMSFDAEARAYLEWVPLKLPRGCSVVFVTRSERLYRAG